MAGVICENILNLKQIIIDEGLYEAGMTEKDMQQIYKTLSRSKRTANDEGEYRELLSQTDLNCTNIELLTTKTNDKTSDKGTIKENAAGRSQIRKTTSDDKNIDFNFKVASNYKCPIPIKRHDNICPIIYHHPSVLKLPVEIRAEIIMKHLQYQLKNIEINTMQPPVPWSKPIVPKPEKKFTGNICAEEDLELSETEDKAATKNDDNNDADFLILKSRRIVKRKTYEEINSDEEFNITLNKKTKSNIDDSRIINKKVELKKLCEKPSTSKKAHLQAGDSDEDFNPVPNKKSKQNFSSTVAIHKSTPHSKINEIKWFPKNDVENNAKLLLSPKVNDRTNKLFDKLQEEEIKRKQKENTSKLESANLSDSSDDIFPNTETVVNIHTDITPKIKRGKSVSKKAQAKSRKIYNLRAVNEEKPSNTVQISTTNFYGKNKENELDASNNNKSTASKMTPCPICSQLFQNSEIVNHASRCEQFDESQTDSLCVICNKYILNCEMDAHKFYCLKNITDNSTEKPSDENKNKSKIGFLCSVCDKYVIDCDQLEHASNCIATLNDV